ncbi:unnamed protein product [Rhizophagus irregularis]|nr:unnamed protein product [Rhizophagus irregularis]
MIFNGIIITMHCIGAQPETCLQIQVTICLAVDKVTVSGLLFSYLLSGTNAFTNLSKRPCKRGSAFSIICLKWVGLSSKLPRRSYRTFVSIVTCLANE